MTDELTGPELLKQSMAALRDVIEPKSADQDNAMLLGVSTVHALHALTAAVLMSVENSHQYPPYETETWRDVIPLPPLKECKSQESRRPQCEERHTEDCVYADPIPEPKHVLLPVGTRVLVSEPEWDENEHRTVWRNPKPGKIVGYDMSRSKYRWRHEYGLWRYASHDSWAFVDNGVVVHPDGPECPPEP